jgi:hypothetical protein
LFPASSPQIAPALYCFTAVVYFDGMFTQELKGLLVQVITSWQVLVVTGVLVLYILVVNSVSRLYRRRPPSSPGPGEKGKKGRKGGKVSRAAPPAVVDDDLGLEESAEGE